MLGYILALTISGTLISPDPIIIKAPDEEITILPGSHLESDEEVIIYAKHLTIIDKSYFRGKYLVLSGRESVDFEVDTVNGDSYYPCWCAYFLRPGVDLDFDINLFFNLQTLYNPKYGKLYKTYDALPKNFISENAKALIETQQGD